jgi:long-chain fatty acid transport protein
MKISYRALASAAVSLIALAAASSGANAGGFAVREQSATAQGLSFAGAASGSGGLSSTYWNPATITMKPGWQSEWHASVIIPQSDLTLLPGTSPLLLPLGPGGDIGLEGVIPASYSSYQLTDQLWIGLSSTAPYGLATKAGPIWAGEHYARTTKIASINLNPIVGWKVTDWLSIAAGPTFQYADLTLRRALIPRAVAGGLGLAAPPDLEIELDDIGVGFTAGVNVTPWAGTSVGVGYRSAVDHELEGKVRINPGLPALGQPARRLAQLDVTTPELLTVGLSQYLGAGFTIHAGYEWSNWSRLKTLQLVEPNGVLIDDFPLNWKDGHFYSLGLEYQFTPHWTVRAGVAFEESPVTDVTRHPRLPDNDRVWLSAGLGYKWSEKLSFDLSYTHIFVEEAKINLVPGHQDFDRLPLVAEADGSVDIISLAIKYRWDTPVVAAVPTAPIVRKY